MTSARKKQLITRNAGSKTSKKKSIPEKTETINVDKIFNIINTDNKRQTENNNPEPQKISCNTDNASQEMYNTYNDAKQFLSDHNIIISTITLDCKLHTLINVDVFSKNVDLIDGEIVSVKYGNRNDTATNRTIITIPPKKKTSKKAFYNQVTILMKPKNNRARNYINIKVFKNGSLQMTGCKDMDDFNNVAHTLINILTKGKDIYNRHGKIRKHINYIESPAKIGLFDIKIRMINSNFNMPYKIDRKKLSKLLTKYYGKYTKDKEIGYVEHKYSPNSTHSCVNIKYKDIATGTSLIPDNIKRPSIFVFQTGSIIITGAKNLQHIIASYIFIQLILEKFLNKVKIIDLDPVAIRKELVKYFREKRKQELALKK